MGDVQIDNVEPVVAIAVTEDEARELAESMEARFSELEGRWEEVPRAVDGHGVKDVTHLVCVGEPRIADVVAAFDDLRAAAAFAEEETVRRGGPAHVLSMAVHELHLERVPRRTRWGWR
ncbi:hypothetical protein DNL40_03970 [Xylanimonas oleitrophica]|uniref:Uncharacterized protein n=1 Tax=Xylanimonas oleitrophica TaxID=2607479 RepID=A0A2W5Y719_9MICO|nr:hypothetical protein [Xylanimonas oleitrophica]PZR54104.1 hypothetical protein DNL40_03970 [Xylanimonas oleitrophica]